MPEDDNTIFLIPRLSLYLLVTRVSQSYERKWECLIRKKLEVLRKEFPLLSKSIIDNFRVFQSEVVYVSDALPTFNHNPLHRQCYCNNRKSKPRTRSNNKRNLRWIIRRWSSNWGCLLSPEWITRKSNIVIEMPINTFVTI